jgi:hypothetical protein
MIMILRIHKFIVLALLLLVIFNQNVQAKLLEDVLKDFRAKLYAYFKNQPDPILPIFIPAGEVPGDVYRDAFGGYFARQKDCFNGPEVNQAHSKLLRVLDTTSSDFTGGYKGRFAKIAKAGADLGFTLDQRIEIRFDDVTISVCSDFQLKSTFRSNIKECDPVAKLMSDPGEGNSALILGQVLVGSQTMETTASLSVSGQAGGQVDLDIVKKKLGSLAKVLEKIGFSLELISDIKATGSHMAQTKISLTDPRKLPIGYRPAFVSQRHLENILWYIEKGTLRSMEDYILKTNKVIVAAKEWSFLVIPTEKFVAEMVSGQLVPFNEKNPEHIKYLKGVGLILSVGTEAESRQLKKK